MGSGWRACAVYEKRYRKLQDKTAVKRAPAKQSGAFITGSFAPCDIKPFGGCAYWADCGAEVCDPAAENEFLKKNKKSASLYIIQYLPDLSYRG